MFLRAVGIVALCVVACRRAEPLERLPAPPPEIEEVRPPPPPPPPGEPVPIGPPAELWEVVAPRAERARARLFELTDGAAAEMFLGYGIKRTQELDSRETSELIKRLAREDAFLDGGDYGCVGDPIGLRIVSGLITRDVVVDCAHVYFTANRHDGPFVLLAADTNEFIYGLR
jgi:hypothetical protein